MPINMSKDFEDKVNKIKGAKGRGGGNWIKGEGLFDVEILSVQRKMAFNKDLLKAGRQVRDKELFIAEFRIHTSTHAGHAVGTTASWSLVAPSDENGGAGDLKNFCIAVTGVEPASVKETDDEAQQEAALLALAALGEDEAFKALEIPPEFFNGKRLKLETKNLTTKTGGAFTKHVWSPAAA